MKEETETIIWLTFALVIGLYVMVWLHVAFG